jgi:hypothetical protein
MDVQRPSRREGRDPVPALPPTIRERGARAQLWGRLNGVPGIGLERNLGGWPTFKIARLTDPETLRRFVQVLDFVVDESLGAGV